MKKYLIIILLLIPVSISPQNRITKTGLGLIQYFEGFKGIAYQDVVGVWTIGFGSTRNVKPGMVISKKEAVVLLLKDAALFEKYVNKISERLLKWYEFDALTCFSFNVGFRIKGNFKDAVNQGNTKSVVMYLQQYIYAGGKVLKGLRIRRDAEASLYQNRIPSFLGAL